MKKNGLWNSVNAASKPVFASKIIKNCEKSQKTPKGRKKTPFAVVDKRRFFYGGNRETRTLDLTDVNRAL